MTVTCTVKYSELMQACRMTWGPRAWISASLIRLLGYLGIGIDWTQ